MNRWGRVTGEEDSRDLRASAAARRQRVEDALQAVDAHEAFRKSHLRTAVPEVVDGAGDHDPKVAEAPPAG